MTFPYFHFQPFIYFFTFWASYVPKLEVTKNDHFFSKVNSNKAHQNIQSLIIYNFMLVFVHFVFIVKIISTLNICGFSTRWVSVILSFAHTNKKQTFVYSIYQKNTFTPRTSLSHWCYCIPRRINTLVMPTFKSI